MFGMNVAKNGKPLSLITPNMNRHTDNTFREAPELPKVRTMFEDLDRAAVDSLAERFAGRVPESRIIAMRELPTSFDDTGEFQRAYDAAAGRSPENDVLGFSTGLDAPAHIRTDDLSAVPEAVIHERMHQLADPSSDRLLGKSLDEGFTERWALETADLDPEIWPQVGYETESRRAAEIEAAVGRDSIEAAYFEGDSSLLAERLEKRLNELPEEENTDR